MTIELTIGSKGLTVIIVYGPDESEKAEIKDAKKIKQAPRCWNKRFGDFLLRLDFKVSQADPCLYIRNQNGRQLLVVLYVDDAWMMDWLRVLIKIAWRSFLSN
ncbi:Reverse transcriptase (RNA-dependent DNA polymerase) [Popillia japonica]|uniref:Reverse transcriptase (RNA-dependent DNA polymerase) n=1 Tax=Popillia japonica TaxID=7064 RepID=A0AAW1LWC2_POPJA